MPSLHLLSQDSIHHPLLLQHVCAAELFRRDFDAVHGAAAPGYVLDHELRGRELGRELVPYFRLGGIEVVGLLGRAWTWC